jgi:hypothetical protein
MMFETALDMARRGREMWLENPVPANFRIWRDASETAIRWHRTLRLAGKEPDSPEDVANGLLTNAAKHRDTQRHQRWVGNRRLAADS